MVRTQNKKKESNLEDKTLPKREPPKKLGELIKLINFLEPDVHLSPLSVRSEDAHNWKDHDRRWSKYQKPYEKWTEAARWSLNENLEGLPIPFQNYIWGDAAQTEEYFEPDFDIGAVWGETRNAVERYENFCRLREQFDSIADFAMRHPLMLQELNNLKGETATIKKIKEQIQDKLFSDKIENLPLPFIGVVKFEIDSRGMMKPKASELVEANIFTDKEIFTLQIRKCLICDKIFWAKRPESFACNAKCGNKLRGSVKIKMPSTQAEKDVAAKQKKDRRRNKEVKKLNHKYKNTEQWVGKIDFAVFDTNGKKLVKKDCFENTELRILNVDFDKENEFMPFQVHIENEKGEKGYFELENVKIPEYHLDKLFNGG